MERGDGDDEYAISAGKAARKLDVQGWRVKLSSFADSQ